MINIEEKAISRLNSEIKNAENTNNLASYFIQLQAEFMRNQPSVFAYVSYETDLFKQSFNSPDFDITGGYILGSKFTYKIIEEQLNDLKIHSPLITTEDIVRSQDISMLIYMLHEENSIDEQLRVINSENPIFGNFLKKNRDIRDNSQHPLSGSMFVIGASTVYSIYKSVL